MNNYEHERLIPTKNATGVCMNCGMLESNVQSLAMKKDFRTFESGATRDTAD